MLLMNLVIVVVVASVLGIIAVVAIRSSSSKAIAEYDDAMHNGYNTEIKSEVQTVLAVLQEEYDSVGKNGITEEKAKEEAKEIVRAMRYRDDGSGYFWIDDKDYNLIMHPILAEQEGNNRHDLKDQNGVMIIQEIMKVSDQGGGYNEFYFTKSDGVTVAPKIAYSQMFEPWGWVVSTGNYVDDMEAEMEQVKSGIQTQFKGMLTGILTAVLIVMIFSMIIANIFGNRIQKPLAKIQGLARRMSEGDLTTPVEVKTNNELGITADALNEAQRNIVVLISDITDIAQNLSDAVKVFGNDFERMDSSLQNVTSAINEIAQNSTSQAGATGEATTGIGDISNEIGNTAEEVFSLNENVDIMRECAGQSKAALKDLIEINTKTKENIDSMYEQTKQTGESVDKISNAVTLISEISSQTNLLSLNASIEAARAGESGRGFAVVAGEIGQLASQSAGAAGEISNIIKELTGNSEKSARIMQTVAEVSDQQMDVLRQTREMFVQLEQALNACIDSLGVITGHITAVNSEKENVLKNVTSLGELATDNASSTQETSSMATELEDTVNKSSLVVHNLSESMDALLAGVHKFRI